MRNSLKDTSDDERKLAGLAASVLVELEKALLFSTRIACEL